MGRQTVNVLVTGAGGFLGGAIARALVARGDRVRSFSRGSYPELSALGVEHVRGDLSSRDDVLRAAEGVDAVVHTAAKAGVWGDRRAYVEANVTGTEHVLDACRAQGVRKLVHTSTPSVVHAGGDIEGGDESLPYASNFATAYPETKAIAERAVLGENGPALATVALRPHLIWGPGDPHLVPRILARGKRGLMALPGGGHQKVDTVFVDNAAQSHLCALDRVAPDAACAGRAYFVTNHDPRPLREIVLAILRAGGIRARIVSIPVPIAMAVGGLFERAYRAFQRDEGGREPPLTRFVVEQLATAHYFDPTAARRDLGYEPAISIERGLELLAASLR